MMGLTVIVTAYNDSEGLEYTLEGLCEQTVEDFDVLIVDNGSTDATKDVAEKYCREYVGFEYMHIEHTLNAAARNSGVKKAEKELVFFIDSGDYISPETVENILKTAEDTKADIICPRYYYSGDNEPYYLDWADMLALVPNIDRFDRALLNTLDIDGRVFKKKFFDLYSLCFPEVPCFYNAKFLADCIFGCDAKSAGCAGAVYARRSGVYSKGFPEGGEPSVELMRTAFGIFDKIFEDIKAIIEDETGALDGDEYTYQEFIAVYFGMLTDNFYRYFWYLNDDGLALLREKFEALSALMTDDRRQKINNSNRDLRFPAMYVKHEDAARLPMFSLLADFAEDEKLEEFINSLFVQRFPFFELFVRESLFASPYFPERWKKAPNIHAVPDSDFFGQARKLAAGLAVTVKDNSPLDPRLLSELSVTRAPRAAFQYLFASKRKKYAAKTYLKKKGLSMQ